MTETLRNAAAMHAERHPGGGLGYAHAIVRGLGNLLGRRSAAAGQAPEKAPASTADRAASHRRVAAAGCLTPWGTRLMAEVDLHDDAAGPSGAPAGWIVEVDPQDPDAAPKRRTALGRLGHRGLSCLVNGDGRVVVYCGDGGGSGHLYKFITHGTWQPGDRPADRDLLDDGTLFVAHFAADGEEDGMPVVFDAAPLVMEHGTLAWMPVVAGKRPLTAAYGYAGPAGVRTETRRAAALLRATRMDGITDVMADPEAGTARLRLAGRQTDARSRFNHVIEITEAGGDAAALRAHWEVLSTHSGH